MRSGLFPAAALGAMLVSTSLAFAQQPMQPGAPGTLRDGTAQGNLPMTSPTMPGRDATTGSAGSGATGMAGGGTAAGMRSASALMDKDVYNAAGEEIGEIENLLLDRNGQVRAVVVEWGGFLGLGENRAVVPLERLQLGANENDRVRINMSREEMERLPRYDRNRLAEYGRDHGWGDGLRWHRD